MKWILILLATFLTGAPKKKIVFFGDSITQAGVQPGGYIRVLDTLLQQRGRGGDFELVGAGIGGNKVYDLYLRMEEDVLSRKPDAVVIWVGVNDVWHKSSFGTGTDADKFEKFYTAIIRKLKAQNIQVALCTPAAIGERTDHSNAQDGDLNHYSNIIRRLAAAEGCTLIDLRRSFLDYNVKHNTANAERGILTTDRVHLNAAGNRFVAEAMLGAVDQLTR